MEKLIKIQELTKQFAGREILSKINLEIHRGDSIAFTGHNGSGKSTLLKMIGGLLPYDSGVILRNKNLRVDYIPEHFPKLAITARQYLIHMGKLEGLDSERIRKKIDSLSTAFYMEEMLDTPIRFLSKGTMQKVCVIQAMLGEQDLLLLDEPLSGQDEDSKKNFLSLIKERITQGTAVVMSCHEALLMREVSREIYQIENKRLVRTDLQQLRGARKILVFEKGNKGSKKESLELVRIEEGTKTKVFVSNEDMDQAVKQMLASGYEIRGIYDEEE
ncbi:ABC transporter, ATP-binding protein [Lachnospiraceae bacterium KM106-2]|nr:ABC transporter, ATP-binding protein [Lachnospiraceae bacterium KM106-2]